MVTAPRDRVATDPLLYTEKHKGLVQQLSGGSGTHFPPSWDAGRTANVLIYKEEV